MPQLEVTTYPSQIFWLVVTFVALFLLLWRVALPRISEILENRQRRIDQDLERAASLRDEAERVIAAYEEELAKARARARQELAAAAEGAAAEAARKQEALNERLAAELTAAEQRIAQARDVALQNVRDIAGELAGAATTRLGGVSADDDTIGAAVAAALQERSR